MRDYAKVSPKFWIGATGKRLRAAGLESQVVAVYLLSSPHANMLGLFYCPLTFIAHETGLGKQGATKGLQGAIEAGFCAYDEASEVVWVHEMARFQVAERLEPKDLRCKGVQNEYDSLPDNPFLAAFFHRYAGPFHMARQRGADRPVPQAPCKPLASQEQEQEQEQEQKNKQPPRAAARGDYPPDFERTWAEYPTRPGNNKAEAFKAWNARLKAGATVEQLADGVRRYAAYCEAERTEPRFIKQAATFFGPDRHYLSDWTPSRPRAAAGQGAPSFHEKQLASKRSEYERITGQQSAQPARSGEVIDITPRQEAISHG